jgi:hypothetical protein
VLAVGESVPLDQRLWWALLAGLLLAGGAITLLWQGEPGRRTGWLLLLYLGVPLLATWFSAANRPIFNERYLVAAAPPFYLLIAAITSNAKTQRRKDAISEKNFLFRLAPLRLCAFALSFLLIIGGLFSLNRHYTDPAVSKTRGWRELAAALHRFSAQWPVDQVRIAQNFPDPTLWYYYSGPVAHIVLPPAAQDSPGAAQAVQQLADSGVRRVILPIQPAPNWDNGELAQNALGKAYVRVAETTVGVWPVQIYDRAPPSLTTTAATFEHGLRLIGSAHQPTVATPGNVLTVYLAWSTAPANLSGSEKVFVQLLNGAGQLVAQNDQPLLGDGIAAYGILLPSDLPAREYQLITGVYDPAQSGAPRLLTETGAEFVTLSTVQVVGR